MLEELKSQGDQTWDIVVIGGGATGLGTALEATTRGFKTLLLEQADFAKGTSSRSTKLVHGGVRYLAQGDVGLVREALKERGLLLRNAPHLVKNLSFIIPAYQWWTGPYYAVGLKVYDGLSGKLSLGSSKFISKKKALAALPTLKQKGLKGGIMYQDGQFDDARLALNIAQTAAKAGATILNYFKVTGLKKSPSGKIQAVQATDLETRDTYDIQAKLVINATGVFVDDILRMDQPEAKKTVKPSQGVHIVLDKKFLPSDSALMIPKTEDGRVLFAIPWHEKVVVGTTDTPIERASLEPRALDEEIDFILRTAQQYLSTPPQKEDVRAVYSGLRPLAAPQGDSQKTKEISRSHKIVVSDSHLITIIGGKWTTYRKMGEDVIDKAIQVGDLEKRASITAELAIHGHTNGQKNASEDFLKIYGSDAQAIRELMEESKDLQAKLHPDYAFNQAQVVWAAREEMARTVEDVLSRRMRILLQDAQASLEMAPQVARLLASELGKDEAWQRQQVEEYQELAKGYMM